MFVIILLYTAIYLVEFTAYTLFHLLA